MTENQAKNLRRLINRKVRAEVANSWIGASQPDDHAAIRHDLAKANEALSGCIRQMTDGVECSRSKGTL